MVSLSQKLNFQIKREKRLYKDIKVLLGKKRLQKQLNIRKMRPFLKLAKMATIQRP